MDLCNVTFTGPPIDDEETLAKCESDLAQLLLQINGFIQFGGA